MRREESEYTTDYYIHYTISDDYNFEQWKLTSNHSKKTILINNLGGYVPQALGILKPYHWSYSGYYTLQIGKNKRPYRGAAREWVKEKW